MEHAEDDEAITKLLIVHHRMWTQASGTFSPLTGKALPAGALRAKKP